jgi:antitoxin VapB
VSLNIKNERTHRLVAKLAKVTGESMTEAVTKAVEERLERVQHKPNDGMAARLLEIGGDVASRLQEPYKSMNFDEFLYDEKGLPK